VKGTLYIVSTPIGNLEDITLRALRVLSEVDLIAAEDARHSLKLLNHHGIRKPMISYRREKEDARAEDVIKRLDAGQSVALISDAGTPGISDPGSVLIKKAIDEDIPIVAVPGPTALVAALSLSGLRTDRFTFLGFLPARSTERRKALETIRFDEKTIVFYEAPHRIAASLQDMADILGERRAAVVKELTKIHEQVIRGVLPSVAEAVRNSTIAGEYVVVVEGWSRTEETTTETAVSELRALMKKGLSRKEAAQRIAQIYGLPKRDLYRKSLGPD